jgi:hypothetical protein
MWVWIDYLNGHMFEFEAMRYWNSLARLLIYAMFVYGLSVYAKTVETHRKRLEAYRRLVPMCHGCGKILWKDGTWKTPEETMEDTIDEVPECPDCALHAQGVTSH